MELNPLDTEQIGIQTLEKSLMKSTSSRSLKIGLPKEISNDERRVSLTPEGVSTLVANGHEVSIEKNAGIDGHFSDNEYSEAGAEISYSAEELFNQSELIVKVAPPTYNEQEWMQPNQILVSALHLGHTKYEFLKTLIEKGVCAIGYEFIKGQDGEFPIVRMMHEITGSMAVQIATHYLENRSDGQGIMLGGISGVPPATVVILGAGITGEYAARTALGYGAQVFVMDNNLAALRRLENAQGGQVVIHHKNLCAIAKGCSGGVFTCYAGTQNNHGGRRHSGNTAKHNALPVTAVFKIVCGNLYRHRSGYFMHHPNNRELTILPFDKLIANSAHALFDQRFQELILGVAKMERRYQDLVGLHPLLLIVCGRSYFYDEL